MKVVILSTGDIGGGYWAAYRLHKALLEGNIDSVMLVQDKKSGDSTVITVNNKFNKYINDIRASIDGLPVKIYSERSKTLFSPSWLGFSKIANVINDLNPDVVHFHWICGGMLNINSILRIKAPIVWSLHDMWPFTGGCHYDENCGLYKSKCGQCKVLKSKSNQDLSSKVWKSKKSVFDRLPNMTIVGLSSWLNQCSKDSSLLDKLPHHNIPNPIDTKEFRPIDRSEARKIWKFPLTKKIILFGAMSAISDPRKGFIELSKSLKILDMKDVELVVFGSNKPLHDDGFSFQVHYTGHLYDRVSLVTLYNAVDVMVVPSLQENLSNAIMESMACGTPVVGFDIGGNSDMVDHKINGYLAQPTNEINLKDGISWVLNNDKYELLRERCRQKVMDCFDSVLVAQKYIDLYTKILNIVK